MSVESADAAAFGADTIVSGTLGEPARTFDGTGTLLDTDAVTFDQQGYRLIEPQDTAAFVGGDVAAIPAVIGTLEAAEGADSATMVGVVPVVTQPTSWVGGGVPW